MPATITVQVGQCGNQVGAALWRLLRGALGADDDNGGAAHASWLSGAAPAPAHFFREGAGGRRSARCVAVDADARPVCAALAGGGLLEAGQALHCHASTGGCWPLGYGISSGAGGAALAQLGQQALEGVRREAEACDSVFDLLLLHGLAGGAGAGLGARIAEGLRDEYRAHYLLSAAVAPYPAGEGALAAANTCLAAAWLQAYADGIMLFQNADLLAALARRKVGGQTAGTSGVSASAGNSSSSSSSSAGSLERLNAYIAECLAGALAPDQAASAATSSSASSGGGCSTAGSSARSMFDIRHSGGAVCGTGGAWPIRELVAAACPDPAAKWVEARAAGAASGAPTWTDVARGLGGMAPAFDTLDGHRPVTSTATLLIARGSGGAVSAAAAFQKSAGYSHVAWCDAPVVARYSPACLPGLGAPPSGAAAKADGRSRRGAGGRGAVAAAGRLHMTAVSNRSNVVGVLETAAQRAAAQCSAGAFTHWYQRHGCSKEAILEAAETVACIVDCYRLAHDHALE